jgi:YbbR domain-containing protein
MEKLADSKIKKEKFSTHSWAEDWILKLLALICSCLLWYFVVGEEQVDMNVVLPVEIVNLPRNLVISNQFKKELEVTISGPQGVIRGLTEKNITRTIDLSRAVAGTVVIKNLPENISLPRGLKIQRIQPTNIILLLDKLINKELVVKTVVKGEPPEGYELVSILLKPNKIQLTGPNGVLAEEDYITTNLIDIGNLTETSLKVVSLNLKPAIADLIGETVVEAVVHIQEKIIEKKVHEIPVEFFHSAERTTYRMNPRLISVRAAMTYGKLKSTKDLTSLFKASVDASDLPPGKHQLAIKVEHPPWAKLLDVFPDTVILDISDAKPAKKRKPVKIILKDIEN